MQFACSFQLNWQILRICSEYWLKFKIQDLGTGRYTYTIRIQDTGYRKYKIEFTIRIQTTKPLTYLEEPINRHQLYFSNYYIIGTWYLWYFYIFDTAVLNILICLQQYRLLRYMKKKNIVLYKFWKLGIMLKIYNSIN